jgi:hypothetical protein
MKFKLITLIALALSVFSCKTSYKLGQYDQLFLDFKTGTLNGVSASASMAEVKKAFPCFTGETEEGSEFNCGGGVFILKHDFYFYTHNDFIEVRKGFTGKMSTPVLNLKKEELISILGTPDDILKHEDTYFNEVIYVHQYSKKWGVLSFVEQEGRITEIELHKGKKIGSIDYCF